MLQNWINGEYTIEQAKAEVIRIDDGLGYALNCGAIPQEDYDKYLRNIYKSLNAYVDYLWKKERESRDQDRIGRCRRLFNEKCVVATEHLVGVKPRMTAFSNKALKIKLFNLDGRRTYIKGSWIWVEDASGEENRYKTKEHREFLKANGFRWSGKKQAWYCIDGVMNFSW